MKHITTLLTDRLYYNINEAADKSLTVDELISRLQKLPGDAKVVFGNDYGHSYGYISDGLIGEEDAEEKNPVTTDVLVDEIKEVLKKSKMKHIRMTVGYQDEEAVAVGYQDGGILGVGTVNDNFYPIEILTDDEIEEIWSQVYGSEPRTHKK